MAKNAPKKLMEVPKWFKRSNYYKAEKLRTTYDWAVQLGIRVGVYEQLRSVTSEGYRWKIQKGRKNYPQAICDAFLDMAKVDPLQDWGLIDNSKNWRIHHNNGGPPSLAVLTGLELLAMHEAMPEERTEPFRSKTSGWAPMPKGYWDLLQPWHKVVGKPHPYGGHPFTVLVINGGARDDQLQEAFSQWLQNFRKKYGRSKWVRPYSASVFQNWRKAGVIPYLDLRIMEIGYGQEISRAAIGRAILNHDPLDPGRYIRKTTEEKHLSVILDPYTLPQLIAQAREKG